MLFWIAGNPRWSISTLVSDINCFANSFSSCFFLWINRSGNAAAHATAKYALACLSSFCLLPSNLPTDLASACLGDALALSVSFWLIYWSLSKKEAVLQEKDKKGFDCQEKKKKKKEARRDSYIRYNKKEMEFFIPIPWHHPALLSFFFFLLMLLCPDVSLTSILFSFV